MKIILEVEDNKAALLLAFLQSISYVKVLPTPTENPGLAEELEEAVEELNLVRAGKKKTRTLKEFLDEL